MVNLTATSASGSTFAGWSRACTGTGSCSVSLTAVQAVTATFNSVGGAAGIDQGTTNARVSDRATVGLNTASTPRPVIGGEITAALDRARHPG
ncbi:MAG TPA: hypothetical protein VM848_16355 [Acidimicrobiia bacterium]|nr:hypothetical protein [Acidimicrobiia bacterium]